MKDNILIIIIVAVFATFVFGGLICLLIMGVKDGVIFHGGGTAIKAEDREKVLVPRSKITEKERKRSRLRSLPFFIVTILMIVLTIADVGNFHYNRALYIYYAIVMLPFGIYALIYRRSYYDRKGKILRNVIDLLYLILLLILPVVTPLIDSVVPFNSSSMLCLIVFLSIVAILRNRLRKCEIIKPEEDQGC